MEEAIKNFPNQFAWDPIIENAGALKSFKKFLLVGMGGSAHAGNLMQTIDPSIDLVIHRDYDIPKIAEDFMQDRLVIASSYSGNTKEVLSAFEEAIKKKIPVCAISIGGKLLEFAKNQGVPYIQIPWPASWPKTVLFVIRAPSPSITHIPRS